MQSPIINYIVNKQKHSMADFENLANKPELPVYHNFGELKEFVTKNTSNGNQSEILVNTDNGLITLNLK